MRMITEEHCSQFHEGTEPSGGPLVQPHMAMPAPTMPAPNHTFTPPWPMHMQSQPTIDSGGIHITNYGSLSLSMAQLPGSVCGSRPNQNWELLHAQLLNNRHAMEVYLS
jgi:hypothetical protein